MLVTGKKKQGFSLVEILVSLSIFTFIITAVTSITFTMVATQKRIQAQLFLDQTAQTTLETISRQLRYGYNYSGVTSNSAFDGIIRIDQILTNSTEDLTAGSVTSQSLSQLLANVENSPYIVFESQSGNPSTYSDQNVFCAINGSLRKITNFGVQTNGTTYEKACSEGVSMLPDQITLESISFDIFSGTSGNPKNPLVRIKLKLKHQATGSLEVQTTITQRLVTYF